MESVKDREIVELYKQGKSMNYIGHELGVSNWVVNRTLKANGVKARKMSDYHRDTTDETRKRLSESLFKGGVGSKKKIDGYMRVYFPEHPYSDDGGFIAEHILVVEAYIGRRIASSECIHHINGNRSDNRVANLALMTKSDHAKYHSNERWGNKGEAQAILDASKAEMERIHEESMIK